MGQIFLVILLPARDFCHRRKLVHGQGDSIDSHRRVCFHRSPVPVPDGIQVGSDRGAVAVRLLSGLGSGVDFRAGFCGSRILASTCFRRDADAGSGRTDSRDHNRRGTAGARGCPAAESFLGRKNRFLPDQSFWKKAAGKACSVLFV